jgi:rhomboid family GlyGly-CTERM serine protease
VPSRLQAKSFSCLFVAIISMKSLRAPLLLFVLPAVLVALVPMSHRLLVLDRHALAAGEIWRLWTGHWVHFSASHLGWNLAVLVAAGTWLERLHPGRLFRHTLVAAPLIGSAVLAGEPGLDFYGGLSGLATGVVVLLALPQVRTSGAGRWLWAGVLALVALKLVRDQVAPAALFADLGTSGARASTTAHAAGAVAALLHHALNRWQEWRQGAPTPQVAPPKTAPPGPVADSRRQGSGHYP